MAGYNTLTPQEKFFVHQKLFLFTISKKDMRKEKKKLQKNMTASGPTSTCSEYHSKREKNI